MKHIIIGEEPTSEVPKGVTCLICSLTVKPGQLVFYQRYPKIMIAAWHSDCIEFELEFVKNAAFELDKESVDMLDYDLEELTQMIGES